MSLLLRFLHRALNFREPIRMREMDKVVAEIQGLTRWGILFADDNVIGNAPISGSSLPPWNP